MSQVHNGCVVGLNSTIYNRLKNVLMKTPSPPKKKKRKKREKKKKEEKKTPKKERNTKN